MAKKTKKTTNSSVGREWASIIAGPLLLFFAALVFLGDANSTLGSLLGSALTYLMGESYKWIFSPIIAALGVMIIFKKTVWNTVRFTGLLLYFISIGSILEMISPLRNHGLLDCSEILIGLVGKIPAALLLATGFFASLYLVLHISYRKVLSHIHERLPSVATVKETVREFKKEESVGRKSDRSDKEMEKIEREREKLEKQLAKEREEMEKEREKIEKEAERQRRIEDLSNKPMPNLVGVRHVNIEKKEKGGLFSGIFGEGEESEKSSKKSNSEVGGGLPGQGSGPDFGKWEFPPSKLLSQIEHKATISDAEIRHKSILIEETLRHFNIPVEMKDERVGPTVVQYRLDPADGVKLSKIEGLKKDLTLSLKAKSIRIQAPIPGVGLVGVEVPNDRRDTVGIREMIEHSSFQSHKSNLAVVLGKDINGDFIVTDLAKMPHLLVAGQTGSGKSVGMNGFILSLLYKNSPSMLRMIMIDPKRVELGVYDGIPHLLTPVINEPEKALNALKWSVAEMIRRYDVLKAARVRNLGEYNAKVDRKSKMPNIVIIIDELADFMMSGNKKEVENAIARIAQMARAVGMHLVVATQRPSVDVITGLIKANIPSRLAFTVASIADSRTILDRMGAEDLLGNGDMLFSPAGSMAPERIQGAYVSTEEVESVVNFVKRTIDPEMLEDLYDASIVEGDRGNYEWSVGDGGLNHDEDPKIIEEAIKFVRSQGKASTSMLQRHMRLGYSRAARVIDILEEMGVVGPADGSKPREVLG